MTDLPARMTEASRTLGLLAARTRALQANHTGLPVDPLRELAHTLRDLADELSTHTPDKTCALCSVEPVTRPDQPDTTVEGCFCVECIDKCLADNSPRHWCAVDELARTGEAITRV